MTDITEELARAMCDAYEPRIIAGREFAPLFDDSDPDVQAYWRAMALASEPIISRREREAVEAMRERCAGVADEHATNAWDFGNREGQSDVCNSGRNHGARYIATAIRSLT